jgi:hypothetical protein
MTQNVWLVFFASSNLIFQSPSGAVITATVNKVVISYTRVYHAERATSLLEAGI